MPKTILTGVKPTGMPHLGNYVGAIRPALELAKKSSVSSYLFVADGHSLTTVQNAEKLQKMIYQTSAAWLACGLDSKKTTMYRQSDIPELYELNWILSCITPKGLMNRAHSYKALMQANYSSGEKNLDKGVNMGIYNYPILMASDILLFSADEVPVSQDQAQHLEIARDIALKFNRIFKVDLLKIPEIKIKTDLLLGLDGKKMSKSYGNHIPLFCSSQELEKLIMRIQTDSTSPSVPKDPEKSNLFSIYKAFASEKNTEQLIRKYQEGVGWGEVKKLLYHELENYLSKKRKIYNSLMDDTRKIDDILKKGAIQASKRAKELMKKIRQAVGIA